MQKYIFLLIALCLHIAARGQTEYEFEYWFDNDRSTLQTGHSMTPSWQIEADLSSLGEKLHAIHVQVRDSDGVSSVPVTRYFLKASSLSGMSLRYWFDDDSLSVQEGHNTGNHLLLDVAGLADGYHTLQIQTADGFGDVSAPVTKGFIKIPQTIGAGDFTCICMIDDQVFKQEKVSTSQGIVAWDFDVSSLSPGFHRIFIQIVTPSGAASNAWQSFFLREPTLEEYGEMKCVYAIDGAEFYTETGTMTDGCFHFDLDVSSLENGLHRITYMLNNGKGVTTPIQTQFFTKIPLGGNSISEYWYWLNELGDEQAHKVTLPERTNPFSLISLLPVESQSIRSKLFQFRIEDGKPMMYAKNDFHIRFFDVAGRFTDVTKQYVDEQVNKEVKPIKSLMNYSGEVVLNSPSNNEITWYTVECERGDSIALYTSQAASVQAFSPSSENVFSVAGAESVKYGGFHANENGIYYIAVHDVTGSQQSMSLFYQHIDKFYLFGTSKAEFAVLPYVHILEINGNGFDNLQSASIQKGGICLMADSIACLDKSRAKLYFLFSGNEEYGKYDLHLNFDDGEDNRIIKRTELITLSQPSFDNIEISISTPQFFIDPYPVTITVINNSNLAYQAIPFYFAIDHIDCMQSVKYKDFTISCSKEMYDNGLMLNFEYDSFEGNGSLTRVVPAIIPELLPGETQTYSLSIKFSNRQSFNVYAWTGRPWSLLASETSEFIRDNYDTFKPTSTRKRATGVAGIFDGCEDDPCDLAGIGGALAECACGTAMGLGGTLGGIQNALQNQHNRAMRDQLAQSGLFDDPGESFHDRDLPSPEDLMWYWLQHCLQGKAEEAASAYNTSREMMGDDPCQDPPPHQANPNIPSDPNDIYGYLSEAGSKFIADSVARVNYIIEFENDTTFATAAAHTIVIKDTLDSQYFDLAKFMPTGIRIGEHEAFLDEAAVVTKNNVTSFVKTIDMRPEIYAIAQVDGTFNSNTGIAQWTFQSLDPMTMEPTDDLMQGILPVNHNGTSGIGEVMFEVGVKQGKADGTQIKNRAGIVFDYEEAILTPTWTNIVDAVAPSSFIDEVVNENDSTISFHFFGEDNASGIWKYRFYVQAGQNAPWWEIATDIAPDSAFCYRFYDDIDYGFCVLAVDSAGNVEKKVLQRECRFKAHEGDYEVNVDELPASSTGSTGDSRIYDLSGRRHDEPQEGINIIDNKKVLFRRKN